MGADDSANGIAVLLVVDDQMVRDAIVAYASRHTDIQVSTAASGAVARDRVAAEPVDCVVADPDALTGDAAQFVAVNRTPSTSAQTVAHR